MGDYAASGGYYISCAADAIVAEPNTITGSIGIFGLFPDMQGLFNKIGVGFESVNTNKFSNIGDVSRPMTDLEKNLVQKMIERGYETFTKRCAEGRKMSIEQIRSIAEGRVYSGTDALKIGLVDTLGTLNDAVVLAAKKANITTCKLVDYPAQKDFMSQLLTDFSASVETKILKNCLGKNYQYFENMQNIEQYFGIKSLMFYRVVLE
jgi:protease-4